MNKITTVLIKRLLRLRVRLIGFLFFIFSCFVFLYANDVPESNNYFPSFSDPIHIYTYYQTPSEMICFDGSNLPGGEIINFGYCGLPENGGEVVEADSCIRFYPNSDFIGDDYFCIVVCDNEFPNQNCDTTEVTVTVMPPVNTLFLEMHEIEQLDTCLNFEFIQLGGDIVSAEIINDNPEIDVTADGSCLSLNLLEPLSEMIQMSVVFCDDSSPQICDTTIIVINYIPDCINFMVEEIIGAGVSGCTGNDLGDVCLPIHYQDISNYSIEVSGQPYLGGFSGCNPQNTFTLGYAAVISDDPDGPYFVESWMINGNTFSGAFDNFEVLRDTMNNWDETGMWTHYPWFFLLSGGNSENEYSAMKISTSTGQIFTIDVNSIVISAGTTISVPVGINNLVITENATGCQDSLVAIVECITTSTLNYELEAGESETICIDDYIEIETGIATIENICTDMSGEAALFSIFSDTTCILVTGLQEGFETGCFVVCDSIGICDTTYIDVGVIFTLEPPIANDDVLITEFEEPIVIDALGNDIVTGLTEYHITTPPQNGMTIFNMDWTVTYVPNDGYCSDDFPDFFTYIICNESGCDSAMVYVSVECNEFKIFTGFSPNGDEINETFVIQGISKYPNHKLKIYSRWGNIVYESEDYKNDWAGKWNGKTLPDGSYFYTLDIGEGDIFTGYVEIRR